MAAVRGLEDALRKVQKLDAATSHTVLSEAAKQGGEVLASAWRARVHRDEGEYQDTIHVQPTVQSAHRAEVSIQTDARDPKGVPYPMILEFGTSTISPFPWARQAFDEAHGRAQMAVVVDLQRSVGRVK